MATESSERVHRPSKRDPAAEKSGDGVTPDAGGVHADLLEARRDYEDGDVAVAGEGGVVRADLLAPSNVIETTRLDLLAPVVFAGGADKFVDNNGPVWQVTPLFLIYWGTAWTATTPLPNPTSARITNACQTMLASAYMTGLAGEIHRISF